MGLGCYCEQKKKKQKKKFVKNLSATDDPIKYNQSRFKTSRRLLIILEESIHLNLIMKNRCKHELDHSHPTFVS
jgi:hypothetical protein